MRSFPIICLCFLIYSCSSDELSKADFLAGTWKMETADQYEVWEIAGNDSLTGYSYILENNQRKITETLSISVDQGVLMYHATVPNQNDGKTISFVLNEGIHDYLSFENLDHDFPKKIRYKPISHTSIEVSVLGEHDDGFNYRLIRQSD